MKNRFGTTSDMVIQAVEEQGNTLYLAIDTKGLYLTTKDKLDTRLADPNRYTTSRQAVPARLTALGLDPEEMLKSNQHLIKVDSSEAKKINPLKASKRGMKG